MATESEIFLYPSPFTTLAEEHAQSAKKIGDTEFFKAYARTLDQIDADLTLFIADFGMGSDAPIALDYRFDRDDPPVISLKWHEAWHESSDNQWVQLAPSFSAFVDRLKLWHLPKFEA